MMVSICHVATTFETIFNSFKYTYWEIYARVSEQDVKPFQNAFGWEKWQRGGQQVGRSLCSLLCRSLWAQILLQWQPRLTACRLG